MTSPGAAKAVQTGTTAQSQCESCGQSRRRGKAFDPFRNRRSPDSPRWRYPQVRAAGRAIAAQRQLLLSCPVRQKAELPYPHKSGRQDMQQKAPDKLRRFQRHDLVLISVRIVFVFKAHSAVLHRQQARVRNGNPMCVARQILQYLLRPSERSLRKNNPFDPSGPAAQSFERSRLWPGRAGPTRRLRRNWTRVRRGYPNGGSVLMRDGLQG